MVSDGDLVPRVAGAMDWLADPVADGATDGDGRGLDGVTRRPPLQPAVRRVYERTKTAILEGALPVGDWVTEGQVAEALSVSRTPVREAFLRLEAEGLLRLYPRRGALVTELTARDVGEVLELRGLLESFAARRIVESTPGRRRDLVARLRGLVEREREAAVEGDAVTTARAGRAVHTTIVHAAENRLLDSFYSMLRDRQQRVGVEAIRRKPDRLPTVLAEHSHLIDLLEGGDVAGYELALQRHLTGTRQALGGR